MICLFVRVEGGATWARLSSLICSNFTLLETAYEKKALILHRDCRDELIVHILLFMVIEY